MDQKWFISSIFGVFCFLNLPDFFRVASYTLSHSGSTYNDVDSNAWENHRDRFPLLQENFQNNLKEVNGNLTEQPSSKDDIENKKWLNILTFDKHCNLTETDKGPQNETKKIFINTEEHLKIFEDEDEEVEDKLNTQLQEEKNIFHLLNPEGFLSQIISQDQLRGLERTKRQAEDGKRTCRCRRKRRRGMSRRRRRRRRNRAGQQRRRRRGRRRNGRRRGRRRCVCRKKEDGEEKSDDEDGEKPEVEEADGEEEGDETTTEGDGEEEDGGEEEKEGSEEESNEEEDDEEEEEEEEDDEGKDDKENSAAPKGETRPLNNIPTYVIPYPNMVETPIAMIPVGGIPPGSYPVRTTPVHRMPSYLAIGALLSGNSNSNNEE